MKLRLLSKKDETEGVTSFIFDPEESLNWQPGQYLHYVLEHDNPDERGTERWFTIATAPYEKNIMITTRFDGERQSSFKQALHNMQPGDEIEADGPKGQFTLQEGEHHHIFIAGGIGITPFRAMIMQLAHDSAEKRIDLLYANRDDKFVFADEFKQVQESNSQFKLLEFTDKRIEEQDLAEYLKDKSAIYYLSGPRSMVEAYEKLLSEKGVEKTAVMTDYFPGYL
jgi:ferredoxin-NADP reductase